MRRTDTTAGEFADFEPCSDKAAPRFGFAAVSAGTAVGKLSADHSFAHSLAVQKPTARDSAVRYAAEMQKLRVKLFHSVYFRAKSARSPFRAKRIHLRYFPAKAEYFPYSECFRQNYPQYTSFIKEAAQLQAANVCNCTAKIKALFQIQQSCWVRCGREFFRRGALLSSGQWKVPDQRPFCRYLLKRPLYRNDRRPWISRSL